jgi:hypothetical protein
MKELTWTESSHGKNKIKIEMSKRNKFKSGDWND